VRFARVVRTAGVSLAALVVLSACGSGSVAPTATPKASGPAASSAAPAPTATPIPSAPIAGLTSVTPAAIPTEPSGEPTVEAQSPDPAFDYGFVIDITPAGFHPNVLVAACCQALTWINLTDKPNRVMFTVELTESPPIPPGGSWTWIPPNVESVAYESLTYPSMTGAIQVNQTSD
jgi:hypothetical protein